MQEIDDSHSHAPRGNAVCDALRHRMQERPYMSSHGDRGN